eukprot:1156700-Pelagomonas_calceolata.AAC.7
MSDSSPDHCLVLPSSSKTHSKVAATTNCMLPGKHGEVHAPIERQVMLQTDSLPGEITFNIWYSLHARSVHKSCIVRIKDGNQKGHGYDEYVPEKRQGKLHAVLSAKGACLPAAAAAAAVDSMVFIK